MTTGDPKTTPCRPKQRLVRDLVRIQLSLQAHLASGTEGALEGTAHLQRKEWVPIKMKRINKELNRDETEGNMDIPKS